MSANAQIECPDCGPPVNPPPCLAPDCSIPANQQNIALFPHPDPNYFWQCAPGNTVGTWTAIARPCACGTVFNPFVYPPRCTFWFERSWTPICGWARPPVLRLDFVVDNFFDIFKFLEDFSCEFLKVRVNI